MGEGVRRETDPVEARGHSATHYTLHPRDCTRLFAVFPTDTRKAADTTNAKTDADNAFVHEGGTSEFDNEFESNGQRYGRFFCTGDESVAPATDTRRSWLFKDNCRRWDTNARPRDECASGQLGRVGKYPNTGYIANCVAPQPAV